MKNTYYFNNPNYTKVEGYVPNINKSGKIIVNESFGTGGRRTANGKICGLVEGISLCSDQNTKQYSYAMSIGGTVFCGVVTALAMEGARRAIENRKEIKNWFRSKFKKKSEYSKQVQYPGWFDMIKNIDEENLENGIRD